jgi:hypothetical protein
MAAVKWSILSISLLTEETTTCFGASLKHAGAS